MCAKSDDEADFNSGVAVGRGRTERRTGAKFLTPFCLSSLLPPSVLPIVRTNARNRAYLPHTDQPLTATCNFFSLPVIPLSLLLRGGPHCPQPQCKCVFPLFAVCVFFYVCVYYCRVTRQFLERVDLIGEALVCRGLFLVLQ